MPSAGTSTRRTPPSLARTGPRRRRGGRCRSMRRPRAARMTRPREWASRRLARRPEPAEEPQAPLAAGGVQVTGVAREDGSLGVEERQLLVEPCRQPPRAVAGELHDRGQQPETYDRGVDQNSGREPDPELLDQREARKRECDEDCDHDRSGAGDDPRGLRDAKLDRRYVRLGAHILLAHPREQEYLIVDRQREGHDENPCHRDHVELASASQWRGLWDEAQPHGRR